MKRSWPPRSPSAPGSAGRSRAPDVMAWQADGSASAGLLLDLEEVRRIVEPQAARLNAIASGDADVAEESVGVLLPNAASDIETLLKSVKRESKQP